MKNKFIQAHFLKVLGPSNVNRDDTGRPKTAIFGGVTRLRTSSQCEKRALRTGDTFKEHFDGLLGVRTRRMGERVRDRLIAAGMDSAKAIKEAQKLVAQFGKLEVGSEKKTETPNGDEQQKGSDKDKGSKGKADKNKGQDNVLISQLYFMSKEELESLDAITDRIASGETPSDKEMILTSTILSSPDIAMFGRMVASDPGYNVEAAVQVSHSITTHAVTVDEDFYTACDDFNRQGVDSGAGFMDAFEFGSGVFYTYICIDRDQLIRNLQGNEDLADLSISVLLKSAAIEGPKGKISSFAHHSRAGYILLESGNQQPRNLVYSFLKPVAIGEADGDLLAASINRLRSFRNKTDRVYGTSFDDEYEINMLEELNSITGMTKWLADQKRNA